MPKPPDIVRSFVARNLLNRPTSATHVLFEQEGTMRLKPEGKWQPFTAEQRASITSVEFVWHARVKIAPMMTAVVEDAFEEGRGRLDVKLWGAIPVAHEEGAGIDRGERQRYLAELPWNPAALVENESLRFEDGPDGSVRVWVSDPETYVDLHFDEAGDIVRTYTETRERGDDGPAPWEGRFSGYKSFGSLRVPSHGEVSWHLPTGTFNYWRGEIVSFDWS